MGYWKALHLMVEHLVFSQVMFAFSMHVAPNSLVGMCAISAQTLIHLTSLATSHDITIEYEYCNPRILLLLALLSYCHYYYYHLLSLLFLFIVLNNYDDDDDDYTIYMCVYLNAYINI